MRGACATLRETVDNHSEKRLFRMIHYMENAQVCKLRTGRGKKQKRTHFYSITFYNEEGHGIVRFRFREAGCEAHVVEAGLIPGGVMLDDGSDESMFSLAANLLSLPEDLVQRAYLAIGQSFLKSGWVQEGLYSRMRQQNDNS